MTTWAEVNTTAPPAGRRLGRIGPLLVLLAVVVAATAWAYSRSGPSIPVVLGEVLVLVTLIRIASARVDHVIGHALTRFGHVVGRVLSVVLLLSVFVVVLVPVFLRLASSVMCTRVLALTEFGTMLPSSATVMKL